MKFLKKFSNFINESYWVERRDRLVDTYSRPLDELSDFNQELADALQELDSRVDELDSKEWGYNRYSRDIKAHYAIDVKLYADVSLEDYKEASGDDEASHDDLDRAWWNWLEFEIEDFIDNVFLKDYDDVFSRVSMAGSSGGWMCPIPDSSLADILQDVEAEMDDYESSIRNLETEELADIRAMHEYEPSERDRLADLGLVQGDEEYNALTNQKMEILRLIEEKIGVLDRHKEALTFIKTKHTEFEKNAKANFLNYVMESQF